MKFSRRLLLSASLATLLATAAPAVCAAAETDFPVPDALRHTVTEPFWAQVNRFYDARGNVPIWIENGALTDRAKQALAHLANPDQEGLDPAHYSAADPLQALSNEPPGDPAVTLATTLAADMTITGQLLHFLYEVRHGRLQDPESVGGDKAFDVEKALTLLTTAEDIEVALQNAVPGNAPYRALRRALSTYQAMARNNGTTPVDPIPGGPSIKPGNRDGRVPLIRDRLNQLGDLIAKPSGNEGDLFDPALVQSVIQFQKRHGLEPDGVVGKQTLAELNISIAARIDQITVNMERWRWLPGDLGDDYILVNIAGFRLQVFELGVPSIEMPVVVGRPFRRTPVFSAAVSYLEFSPTWTVPPTILKEDIIPGMRKDPELLAKKGIRIFSSWNRDAQIIDPAKIDWHAPMSQLVSYRYVQPPGPKNALGRVKFMFPNQYSVYLHDTPDKTLFDRASRAFSSGCIRVERPSDLAALLLSDQPQWTETEIAKAMALDEPVKVPLSKPIPIYITYATAWAGEGGTIEFRPDIYGRDASLQESLAGSPK
ncbi:hypothetical protein EOI86_05665 [Hwanghaeella grinnelliae]|uniref:L,D-TPase catalytic domain-containing protein n=1 Tax=Hwanghaeella grinnelliae TaxID=2500179 RepID=A0A437QW44_9PROT|nr:L,D-transpeptidase family protein [Hwanghaeella grinnelliae]RVU38757.1 hypothetical protein EOI86_05665 [Hwanghaeella grinnelliae]